MVLILLLVGSSHTIYVCTYVRTCTNIHMYVFMGPECVHKYVHTYIHKYIHTYVCTLMYTIVYVQGLLEG